MPKVSERCCDSCEHWRMKDDAVGECRRRAPLPGMGVTLGESLMGGTNWPVTRADDWCGEYMRAI